MNVTTIALMAVPRPLAGRYAFARRVRGTQRTIIWIARDQEARSNVVASVLAPTRVAGLSPAIGLTHPHAAAILSVIDRFEPDEVPSEEPPASDAKIVIAEYFEGRSLQQRLDAGPVTLENAVEWATAVADALSSLHARGAVHGAVSPRAVLVIRPEPAVIPALTHLVVPPSGAYCSPERVTGEGPSAADDVWALAATLYTALARRPPFQGASRTELARAIVAAAPPPLDDVDSDLWAIVGRALSEDARHRFENASQLRDALREWTELTGRHSIGDFAPVEAIAGVTEEPPNVGDLSLVAALARPDSAEALAPLLPERTTARPSFDPDAHSDPHELAPHPGSPEPLSPEPASATTGSATPVVASPPSGKPRRGGAAIAAAIVVLALAAAVAIYGTRARRPGAEADARAPARTAEPPPSAAPPLDTRASTPAPPSASPESSTSAAVVETASRLPLDVNACATATLPEGTLGPQPDIAFLCTENDLWGITRKIDAQVLKHGQAPGLSPWMHLGRYDLAAVAMLRARCCPDAAPFTAATPAHLCETLGDSINAVAAAPTSENVNRYTADVECFVSHGVRYPTEWWDRLTVKDARKAFEELVTEMASRRTPAP